MCAWEEYLAASEVSLCRGGSGAILTVEYICELKKKRGCGRQALRVKKVEKCVEYLRRPSALWVAHLSALCEGYGNGSLLHTSFLVSGRGSPRVACCPWAAGLKGCVLGKNGLNRQRFPPLCACLFGVVMHCNSEIQPVVVDCWLSVSGLVWVDYWRYQRGVSSAVWRLVSCSLVPRA